MVEISKGAEPRNTTSRFRVILRGPQQGQSSPKDIEESPAAKKAKVIRRVFDHYIGEGIIKHFPSDPDSADMIWLTKEETEADGKSHVVRLAGVSNQGKIIMPDGQAASEPEVISWGLPLLGEIQTRLTQAKEKSIAKDPHRVGDLDAISSVVLINAAVDNAGRELNGLAQAPSLK
jgi:hypothetical protein